MAKAKTNTRKKTGHKPLPAPFENPYTDPEFNTFADGERNFVGDLAIECRGQQSKTVYIAQGLNVKANIKRMQRILANAEHEVAVASKMMSKLTRSKYAPKVRKPRTRS